MEEELQSIRNWISHGTLRQFYADVSVRIAEAGYEAEVEGNTLTCYRVRKEGGFLGIGARKIRETVLQIIRKDDTIEIPETSIDEEFVRDLAGMLKQH